MTTISRPDVADVPARRRSLGLAHGARDHHPACRRCGAGLAPPPRRGDVLVTLLTLAVVLGIWLLVQGGMQIALAFQARSARHGYDPVAGCP